MPKAQVIDLSHHNTVVSLHDAAASGIVGVIHKATEGVKMVDKTARARFSLARDAGLLWGVYHFMRPGDVQDQVDHFLSNSPADNQTLYVLDFEVDGITLYQVLEFLDTVEQQTSQIPVLYTGGTIKGLGGVARIPALTAYRLWLAQYSSRPVLPKGYDKLWLWQYSQEGKVPGITGNCDVNAYNGTAEALRNDWVQDSAAIASNNPPVNSNKGESGVTSDANSTSPPDISDKTATTVEQTTTEARKDGDTTSAVATTVTTEAPKGDLPSVPPTQVSKRGPLAIWLFSGGGLMTVFTGIWGFITTNGNVVAVAILVLGMLIFAIIFRHAITDAIRMTSAADVDKKNVS